MCTRTGPFFGLEILITSCPFTGLVPENDSCLKAWLGGGAHLLKGPVAVSVNWLSVLGCPHHQSPIFWDLY